MSKALPRKRPNPISRTGGKAYTDAEVRERERAAFVAGVVWFHTYGAGLDAIKEATRRYPDA